MITQPVGLVESVKLGLVVDYLDLTLIEEVLAGFGRFVVLKEHHFE